MDSPSEPAPAADEIDPDLVEAMRARVVTLKTQAYSKRKAGPGRPKGGGKVPGSGKKAGTPNLMSPEFRVLLSERAKPFELLAAICAGEEIEDAGTKRKPTIPERIRAAETLSRKLLPDLAATTLSGPDGMPLLPDHTTTPAFEVARRLAFLLASGLNAAQAENDGDATNCGPTTDRPAPHPFMAQDTQRAPAPSLRLPRSPESHKVGSLSVSFAETLSGDRERWAIRDSEGKLIGTAFGRDAAESRAKAHLAHEGDDALLINGDDT